MGGLLRRQLMFLTGATTGMVARFTETGSRKEGWVEGDDKVSSGQVS